MLYALLYTLHVLAHAQLCMRVSESSQVQQVDQIQIDQIHTVYRVVGNYDLFKVLTVGHFKV